MTEENEFPVSLQTQAREAKGIRVSPVDAHVEIWQYHPKNLGNLREKFNPGLRKQYS